MNITRTVSIMISCMIALIIPVMAYAENVSAVLRYDPAQFSSEEINRDGQTYTQINLTGEKAKAYHLNSFQTADSVNLPQLPCVDYTYIIPAGHRVIGIANLHYSEQIYLELAEDQLIVPSQRAMPTLDGFAFQPFQHANPAVYQSLVSFPPDTSIVKLISDYGQLEMSVWRQCESRHLSIAGPIDFSIFCIISISIWSPNKLFRCLRSRLK